MVSLSRKIIPFWIFILLTAAVAAQGENANWHFGCFGGLRFENGNVTLIESSLQSREGTASVSNAEGELQFYTDGTSIYNANNEPVADGLRGHPSSTSSAVVIPVRGSPDQYWIFTSDWVDGTNGINYYRYDSGAERIVQGPVQIIDRSTEKLAALKACGHENYWLATLDRTGNYRIYEVGASVDLKSTVATRTTEFSKRQLIGYLKFSEDGTKLASAIPDDQNGWLGGIVQIFEFDPINGEITNPGNPAILNFNLDERGEAIGFPYGLQFSPSGEFLYVSIVGNNNSPAEGGELYQFDVSAANPNATRTLIGSASPSNILYGALQIAPDGKIYLGTEAGNENTSSCACFESRQYLGMIENPDARGMDAAFVQDGLLLGGGLRTDQCSYTSTGRSKLGLPTFIAASTLPPSINSIPDTSVCGATEIRLLRGAPQPGINYTITAPGLSSQDYFVTVKPEVTTTYTIIATSSDCKQASSELTIRVENDLTPYQTEVINPSTCGEPGDSTGTIIIFNPNFSVGDRVIIQYRSPDSMVVTVNLEIIDQGKVSVRQLPAGTYTEFELTPASSCTVRLAEQLTIIEDRTLPAPLISQRGGKCTGTEVTLYAAASGGTQFTWSGPNNFFSDSSEVFIPGVTAETEGLYTLTQRLNECVSPPDSFLLAFRPPPADLGYDTTGCTSLDLDVDYPYAELTWTDGAPTGERTVTSSGVYAFAITTLDDCIVDDSILVQLSPLPESLLPAELSVNSCEELLLDPGLPVSPTLALTWSGDYDLCTNCATPNFIPDRNGLVLLTLNDALAGCVRTDSLRISLSGEAGLYVPNAFSPNGDGVNDGFTVYTCQSDARVVLMEVYDRWGDQLFQRENFAANDPALGWLGDAPRGKSGRVLNNAVFAYVIRLQLTAEETIELKGLVHTVR